MRDDIWLEDWRSVLQQDVAAFAATKRHSPLMALSRALSQRES
jgi:hypothetical protein